MSLLSCTIGSLVAFVTLTSPAYPQQSTARLLGTVTDQSGGLVPGASVKTTNIATAIERTGTADASGEYSIGSLPIGEYSVTVEAPGFKTSAVRSLVLQVDQEARLDVQLTLGSISERSGGSTSTPARN
ncbi:MAG: carboxypeptidase-like regulatory domain-containing protein [Bryobacteraceae bacterium]